MHGVKRRSSSFNTQRIDHLYQDPHEQDVDLHLHYGDMTDATNLIRLIQKTQPDEIYNLAAQSHVQVSFETPEYTANADALGALRILEGIKLLGLGEKTKFIRCRHPNFTEKWLKRRKTNKRPLFQDHPMQPPSFTPIGRR